MNRFEGAQVRNDGSFGGFDAQQLILVGSDGQEVLGRNIIGIGIDECDVPKIQRDIETIPNYTRYVFTETERDYCDEEDDDLRIQRYAARFALKEAVAKSLGGITIGITADYTHIGVHHNERGAPYVALTGKAQERADELGVTRIFVGMSHISNRAIAWALAVSDTA